MSVEEATPRESRSGILGAISDWLKLLGLVVLVAEAVILAAMGLTPENHPLVPWYPIIMLAFLLIIVGAVFLDRNKPGPSPELKIRVGEIERTLDPIETTAKRENIESLDIASYYVDTNRGFSFRRPPQPQWSGPESLSLYKWLSTVTTSFTGDVNEETFVRNASIFPLGSMIAAGEQLVFTRGDPIIVNLTAESSTDIVERIIERMLQHIEEEGESPTEEEIADARAKLFNPTGLAGDMSFRNSFIVSILDKSLAADSPIEPNFPNLFSTLQGMSREPIGMLAADEDAMLWGTKSTINNVLVGDQLSDFSVYRMYQMTQNQGYFFIVGITWTPNSQDHVEVWAEMKKILDSFKVIA